MLIKINNNFLIKVLTYLAVVSFVIRGFQGNVYFLYFGIIFGLFIFCFHILNKIKLPLLSVYLLIPVFMSVAFTTVINGVDDGLIFIPLMLSSVGIALSLMKFEFNEMFASGIFYISWAYVFFLIVFLDYSPNNVISGSRNHISVFFINLFALLYISLPKKKSNILFIKSLIPAILVFIISVLSIGSSGIFSSALLVVLIASNFFSKYFRTVIFSLIICFFVFYNPIINYLFGIITFDHEVIEKLKFQGPITENIRYKIWYEYIDSLNVGSFLWGTKLDRVYAGFSNLHNSYILMHSRMGFFSFLMVFLFISAFFRLRKIDPALAIILIVISLRGFTDTTFFAGSHFDFILVYLLIIPRSFSLSDGYIKTMQVKIR